jgi:short-subunit dehydrogenase
MMTYYRKWGVFMSEIKTKKTALITGASSGLGLEFANIYAKNGYNLVVVARGEGKLYQLKSELESTYGVEVVVYAKDLSKKDAGYEVFDFCLEKNIQVDVLVNNAGFGDFANFAEADWEKQYDMVQVNIVALM